MMVVAPSERKIPVPAYATCIMCLAKSHAGERLDADADEGAQRQSVAALGAFASGLRGVPVLFGVGADAVAVLEVDAEILHRLALQFLLHARVDRLGDGRIDADRLRESG